EQLTEAAAKANAVASGGIMQRSTRESLLRISGRSLTLKDIEDTPVVWRDGRAILIKDVAQVSFAGPGPRGDGRVPVPEGNAIAGGPAVILTVQKQPHANTLLLDRALDQVLDQIAEELPADVHLERHIFKQADFIQSAIHNVEEAIRDGTIWVLVILFLFLW